MGSNFLRKINAILHFRPPDFEIGMLLRKEICSMIQKKISMLNKCYYFCTINFRIELVP